MQTTGNLGLKKPEGTDVVNIDDLNYNADVLDVEVTKLATPSQAGRMSAADKAKLDGITAGAEINQNAFSNVKVGATTIAADSKTDTLEMAAGTGIVLTPDTTNDKVTIGVNATSAATPNTIVQRDAAGRFKAAAPAAADDVARKAETDAALSAAQAAQATADAALPKSGGVMTGDLTLDNPGIAGLIEIVDYSPTQKFIRFKDSTNTLGAGIQIINGKLDLYDNANGPITAKGNDIWTTGMLRDNGGVLELWTGGTWKPMAGVKSIQRGRAYTGISGNNTTDVTISAVNPAKCEIFLPYVTWESDAEGEISAELINSTTLRLYHPTTSSSLARSWTIGWQVTEHY